MNDADLLRRYVEEGSQEAFAELVRLRLGLVYSAALRQTGGDAHRAQEVAQAVFTDLARKAAALCRHGALIGWLYTSTRYTAAKLARSERRRRVWEQEAQTMPEDSAALGADIPGERLRPLLDNAMHHLSETDRRALLLRFFGDYSMAEVGRYLGLSEPTAQKRIERALGKLKISLAQRGLSSTAAAIAAALGHEAVAATVPSGLAATISGGALAAAATPAPGIGLIYLMTAKKLTALIGITSILGLISIGAGVYELRKSLRARAVMKAVSQQYDAEQLQLRALRRNDQAADQALADPPKGSSVADGAGDRAKAAIAKQQADWRRFAAIFPTARGMMVDVLKERNEERYRISLERVGFTSDQIEEFTSRMAEIQIEGIGLEPAESSATQAGIGYIPSENDEQRRVLMGEEAFQRFQNLGGTNVVQSYSLATNIAAATAYIGVPLTTDQENSFAQMLADDGRNQTLSANWIVAEPQTQALLSPAQWKAAEGLFLERRYEIALLHGGTQPGANPTAGTGGK